jgi:peptidoglycan/LPS O-acetylase OafA/YrhL
MNYLMLVSKTITPLMIGRMTAIFVLASSSGVTLFFVLSGFLLFLPYANSLLFDSAWPSAKRFYLRRAFRILPGYYVSLILLVLLTQHAYLQPDHWKQDLLFLTLFMDSSHSTYQAINGPFWTLAVEWQFYLLLPLIALGFRWIARRGTLRRRLYTLWGGLVLLILWGLATRYWGHSWDINPDQPHLLPIPLFNILHFFLYGMAGKYLEDFAIGMLVGTFYTLALRSPQHRLVNFFRSASYWLWGAGNIWLFYTAIWYVLPGASLVAPLIGPHNWLSEIVLSLGFGTCITALLFGPQALRNLLEWRLLRWIGTLSYGMYIWHLPIIFLFVTLVIPLVQSWPPAIIYGLYLLCLLFGIIPFCSLFYRFVELPGIKLGNRLTATRKMAPVES